MQNRHHGPPGLKSAILISALLAATACDSGKTEAAQGGEKAARSDKAPPKVQDGLAKKGDGPSGAKDEAKAKADGQEEPTDPWQKKLADRVLAKSGLGIGGKLSPFDIVNCESGDEYCQVCKFGGNAKIMAVGTADDEKFREDLKNLDAIAQKYGDKNVKAFAVITDIVDGKATSPQDAEEIKGKADAIRKELGLKMPVVVPAPKEGGNKIWDEYYNITESRTVMFADGQNNVVYSSIASDDWSSLGEEIEKVIGS